MKIKLLFISFFLLISKTLLCQINTSNYTDIILNWPNSTDTQFQYFNEIKSIQDETNILNRLFPFQTTQFINSYSKINTYDTITPLGDMDFKGYISWENDSNYYFANKLNFKLESDTSSVFFFKNKATLDTSTAIIIIPGSGLNQATFVSIFNPTNYHNNTCAIAKFCKNYGDVFTYVRPNEDFATIWATTGVNSRKKMNYTALTSKTNLSNKNWAANCYIQINALTKYLKTKYKKVIVIGLSSGSWGAIFSSLQSEPDGAQIASGYSINFTDLTYQYGIDQFHFDGLFTSHPIDSVKKKIKKQSTQYLFSYGSNDAVTHMATENSQHVTQNFINTPDFATNASFFYDFTTHRFPCEALDTFFTRVIKMPKASLQFTNTCRSDSAILLIKFMGKSPYSFDLVRNDTVLGNYTSLIDSISLPLYQQGEYSIKNILDSNQVIGYNSKPISYNFHPKLTINGISHTYLCGTDSTQLTINLSGAPPFNIIKNNFSVNSYDTIITSNINSIYFLPNDNYQFTTISDSNQCIINSNQIINIDYEKLNLIIQTPVYNCDSNKTQINFALQGNAPWTINYTESGIPKQINSSTSNLTKFFNNGSYQFINIIDATGCSQSINQVFNFNYQVISAVTTPAFYNCDSNKTQLNFSLQGNAPFNIQYSQDLIAQQVTTSSFVPQLFLNNGVYDFLTVTDATGCSAAINQNYTINYDTIDIVISSPVYNCDSNKTQINFALQGNAPWTINYTESGTPKQINTSSSNLTSFFNNGSYQFINVIDASGCSQSINLIFNFNYQAISAVTTPAFYNCDSNKTQLNFSLTGNVPFTIQYSKDLVTQQVATSSFAPQLFLNNGVYDFLTVTDATGCAAAINQNFTFNYDTIDLTISTPVYNCDSNKTQINFALQGNAPWTINYTENGMLKQIIASNSNLTSFFNNASYQFINVIDATGCSQSINQVFNFNYQAISASTTPAFYNCDSNKTQLNFSLQGNSPFTIQYSKDLIAQQVAASSFAPQLFLNNGVYDFLTVTDATGCSVAINQNYNFNYDTIDIAISTPVYNCDSNKTQINFALQGNAPWTINYTESGTPKQINTSSSNLTKYFNNGSYQFINVIDATGCSQSINQVFNFNYQAISAVTTPAFYNCDSNKTQLNFSLQGNAPFNIQYSQDLIAQQVTTSSFAPQLFLNNGVYDFLTVTDATGCSAAINQNFTFNYDTIDLTISTPVYNCDSNKTQINFALQGNAPWTINYTESGIPKQIIASTSNLTSFFNNGSYQFINVIDATGCNKNIYQVFNFNFQALNAVITQQIFDCDSNKYRLDFQLTGNAPWTIYYQNSLGSIFTKTTNNNTTSIYLTNDTWVINAVIDNTNCSYLLNVPLNINFNPLSAIIQSQTYDCDSNKLRVQFALQGNAPWQIQYTNINASTNHIFTTYDMFASLLLANGNYYFGQVNDNASCAMNLNTIVTNQYQALTIQKTGTSFNCDSNKVKIDYSLNGNGPWIMQMKNLNTNSNFQIYVPTQNYSLFLSTGNYVLTALSDQVCTKLLNDTIHVNFPNLNAYITPFNIDCDSGKYTTQFNINAGLKPYRLNYTYNNLPQQVISNTLSSTIQLPNGNYNFISIEDSVGCKQMLNTVYIATYTPIQYNNYTTQYNCALDSTAITIDASGTAPLNLAYQINGQNIDTMLIHTGIGKYFHNNNYKLLYLYDAKGCVEFINQTVPIDNYPLQFKIDSIQALCDEKLHQYNFTIEGKSPWNVSYNFENILNNITLNDPISIWKAPAGNYYFVDVQDANGCIKSILRSDSLPEFLQLTPVISTDYKKLFSLPSLLLHNWYFNSTKIDSFHQNILESRGEGEYYLTIIDSAGCEYKSNTIVLDYPENVNLYPNPTKDQTSILIDEDYGEYWNYAIFDGFGNKVQNGIVQKSYQNIDVSTLAAGVYNIFIQYEKDFGKNKRVLRLHKY